MLKVNRKVLMGYKRLKYSFYIIAMMYLSVMLYPNLLFSYNIQYMQIIVHSDREIDTNIYVVVNEALKKVQESDLYDNNIEFRIYICNDLWRFGIFTLGNTMAGGIAHYNFTRDIYIRPCDIKQNKIIPSHEWYFAKNAKAFADRPHSYYFAHEMTHILQSHYTGRKSWSYPIWLTEGYADYIAKGDQFDFNDNVRLWHDLAPELNPKNGLYRLYHLKVGYLLDCKNQSVQEIYLDIPDEEEVTQAMWQLAY